LLLNYNWTDPDDAALLQLLLNYNWTDPGAAIEWQEFYYNASRIVTYGRAGHYNVSFLDSLPSYTDLNTTICANNTTITTTTVPATTTKSISNNLVIHQATFILLLFISFLMYEIIT